MYVCVDLYSDTNFLTLNLLEEIELLLNIGHIAVQWLGLFIYYYLIKAYIVFLKNECIF